MTGRLLIVLALTAALAACSGGGGRSGGRAGPAAGGGAATGGSATGGATGGGGSWNTPSDDPADWFVDTTRVYDPVLSPIQWIAPSPALPARVQLGASNNNCAICFHDGRLYFAWRTAEIHFASKNAKIYVVSSPDVGLTWELEHEVALGADVREPTLISIGGRLILHYFEAGTNPAAFEPRVVWQSIRTGPAQWTAPVAVGLPGEVPWDLKVRNGRAWMTSYVGNHYGAGASAVDVLFRSSPDGINWAPVDPARPVVYHGGLSEVAFEFDAAGDLWAVGRNEDGDQTGFGSHVATAPASALGVWTHPQRSDPERYDSPRMIRHGDDLYLIARRDLGGPFDMGLDYLPFDVRKWTYLGAYSLRPKRTALYAIDRGARAVRHLFDLEGNGDTAFPGIARLDAHSFLIVNYTSPLGNPDRTWIHGQLSPEGTQIYMTTLTFVPR